jgi:hypothetical protein
MKHIICLVGSTRKSPLTKVVCKEMGVKEKINKIATIKIKGKD